MFKLSWSHHILSSSPWVALKLGYKYVQTKTSFLLSILRTACCQDPEYASENEATWETVSRAPNVVEPPASQRHILSEVWFWIDQILEKTSGSGKVQCLQCLCTYKASVICKLFDILRCFMIESIHICSYCIFFYGVSSLKRPPDRTMMKN